jgi:hypothetical protein
MQNENVKWVSDEVKNIFLGVILSLIWMLFLTRLIERWSSLKPDFRETVGMFMVLYCAMCLNIARGNRKLAQISLLLAIVVLTFIYRIVWMLV